MGRDRLGLFLRSLGERCAETSLYTANGISGGREAAHRDSLSPRGKQRQRLGRLLQTDARALGCEGAGRNSALLYRNLATGEARARYRIHDFVCGQFDFSQSTANSRCGTASSIGTNADRDGLTLFGACAEPGKTERTRIRERNSAEAGRVARVDSGRNRPADN